MLGKAMVEAWLRDLMTSYNRDSYAQRAGYLAQVHMPGEVFQSLVWWALQSLPDEILVGIDIDAERPHRKEVEAYFEGEESHSRLFQGQGYVIKEAHIVNRGDSYSVHHLPEDWTDDMFRPTEGPALAASRTGFTRTPTPQRFPADPMLTLHRKPRALT